MYIEFSFDISDFSWALGFFGENHLVKPACTPWVIAPNDQKTTRCQTLSLRVLKITSIL